MADGHRDGVTAPAGPARFDPLDPAFTASPYEHYASLRDDDPVHWSELLCGFVLTRFDDVDSVLREPTMSSDIRRATPNPVVDLELTSMAEHGRASETIVHLDDPDHGRVRKLMAEPFRVREVNRLGDLVDARVTAALDRLAAEHGGREVHLDLVGDLAYPLPVEVFSAWLGVPEEANPQFRELDQLGRPQPRPAAARRARRVLRGPRRDVRLPRRPGRAEAPGAGRRPALLPRAQRGRR